MGQFCLKEKNEVSNESKHDDFDSYMSEIVTSLAMYNADFESIKTLISGDNSGKPTIQVSKFMSLASTFLYNNDSLRNKHEKFHKALFYSLSTSSNHLKDPDHFLCNKLLFTLMIFTNNTIEVKIKNLFSLFPNVFEKNELVLKDIKSIFFTNFKFVINTFPNAINMVMIQEVGRFGNLISSLNKMHPVWNEQNIVTFINYEFPTEEVMDKDKFMSLLLHKQHWFDANKIRRIFVDIFINKSIVLV